MIGTAFCGPGTLYSLPPPTISIFDTHLMQFTFLEWGLMIQNWIFIVEMSSYWFVRESRCEGKERNERKRKIL